MAPPETVAADADDARGRVQGRLVLMTRAPTLALSEAHDARYTATRSDLLAAVFSRQSKPAATLQRLMLMMLVGLPATDAS